jgi:hypothetical protein
MGRRQTGPRAGIKKRPAYQWGVFFRKVLTAVPVFFHSQPGAAAQGKPDDEDYNKS